MDSDRVLVLDKGMIAEYDTPAALLADENSIFYGMAKKSGLINNGENDSNSDEDGDEKSLLEKLNDLDTKL